MMLILLSHVTRGDDPALAVDRYMGRIAARHVPMSTPPPALWRAIVDDGDTGFRVSSVSAAIARARALLLAGGYARTGS